MAKKATRNYKFASLDAAVKKALTKYESQADAARDIEVSKPYINRMLSGVKYNPSDDVLARMGITRHIHYTVEI